MSQNLRDSSGPRDRHAPSAKASRRTRLTTPPVDELLAQRSSHSLGRPPEEPSTGQPRFSSSSAVLRPTRCIYGDQRSRPGARGSIPSRRTPHRQLGLDGLPHRLSPGYGAPRSRLLVRCLPRTMTVRSAPARATSTPMSSGSLVGDPPASGCQRAIRRPPTHAIKLRGRIVREESKHVIWK